MMNLYWKSTVTLAAMILGIPVAGYAAPTQPVDAGAQLRQQQEQRDRWQREEELRKEPKEDPSITDERQEQKKAEGELKFTLTKVTVDFSRILSQEEIDGAVADSIGKEVTLSDLNAMTERINALYEEGGYVTCRAMLLPQKIEGGVLHVTLIEGEVGEFAIEGNRNTSDSFLRDRLHLSKGDLPSLHAISRDLIRLQMTTDLQLQLSLQAGKEKYTTDYKLLVQEPQKCIFSVYSDLAGSDSTGRFRRGIFFNDASLTGRRDALALTVMDADGSHSFSGLYRTPIGTNGSTLALSYSTNSTHIKKGDFARLNVRGHSRAYGLTFNLPLYTKAGRKSELELGWGKQHSVTDFKNSKWVDDRLEGYDIAIAQTLYGRKSVLYTKGGYRAGKFRLINKAHRKYGKFVSSNIYQIRTLPGQMFTLRLNGQRGTVHYLPSAERYYIGGFWSVRGYKESLLSGDSGFDASAEYAFQTDASGRTNAFLFCDYGAVYGDSAFDDHRLASLGLGLRAVSADGHWNVQAAVGFPLQRVLNEVKESRARLHISVLGRF